MGVTRLCGFVLLKWILALVVTCAGSHTGEALGSRHEDEASALLPHASRRWVAVVDLAGSESDSFRVGFFSRQAGYKM